MSHFLSGRERRQRHAQRLAFLKGHADLLRKLPDADEDITPAQRQLLDDTIRWLQRFGLYSVKSELRACRWGLRRAVSELRGRPIDKRRRYGT